MSLTAEPTDVEYAPLPTDGLLDFVIPVTRKGGKDEGQPGVKPQENFFDNTKTDANVEFDITTPGYEKRKMWQNFGIYWPKEDATKTTKLFELVKAVDPKNAVKGQRYDLDNLLGKHGKLMVEDYTKKNGEPGQKIKLIVGASFGGPAAAAPVVEEKAETVISGDAVKPKRIRI